MEKQKLTWGKRKALMLKKYFKWWHPATYAITLFGYYLAEVLTDPNGPFDNADLAGFIGLLGFNFMIFFKNQK